MFTYIIKHRLTDELLVADRAGLLEHKRAYCKRYLRRWNIENNPSKHFWAPMNYHATYKVSII